MAINLDGGVKLIPLHPWNHKILVLILVLLAVVSNTLTGSAEAQSATDLWTPAVNVSQSGAASQPMIAVATDGTLHILWWDSVDGAQYARIGITSTEPTNPTSVPEIVGGRNIDPQTNRVTLTPPPWMSIVANTRNGVHAFWLNTRNQLLSAQVQDAGWSTAAILAEDAAAIDVAADASGALHLAYVRPTGSKVAPAGVYYNTNDGTRWGNANLVYASPYLRTARAEDLHVSVAGNGRGQAIAVWDNPSLGQSLYARSKDNGVTWSEPVPISNTQSALVQHAYVAAAPNGDFLMLWQNSVSGGNCDFTQRISNDGGQTWSAPAKVLGSSTLCRQTLSFMPDAEGKLWLLGRSGATEQNTSSNSVTLAAWDGVAWSEPAAIALRYFDPASQRMIALGCVDIAVAGRSAGAVGCDSNGDVWAARNAVGLDTYVTAPQSSWAPVEIMSDQSSTTAVEGLPAVAADRQGTLYALWSQGVTPGQIDTGVYGSIRRNGQWSKPAIVLRSPEKPDGSSSKADQPAMALDASGKMHAVWTAGIDGGLLYSSSHVRDFVSAQDWAEPVELPTPSSINSWPDIVADQRHNILYIVYAIPYNERRGIYLTRSLDGGTTWLTPTLIFDAVAAQWAGADKARLALDPVSGNLHVTWLRAVLPSSGGSQAVYYSGSTDGGQTWSAPVKAAEGQVDWPRIAVPNSGQVYVAWNQNASQGQPDPATPFGVWGQFSTDGGQQWSEPTAIPGFGEVSGPIGLYADEVGELYVAAIGRESNNESSLISAKWDGQKWNGREEVRLGQEAAAGNVVSPVAVPEMGQLNALMHLYTWAQNGSSRFDIAMTSRTITPTTVTPISILTVAPTATAEPTPTVQPTGTPPPRLPRTVQQPVASRTPSPLLLGGALAAVVVMIVVVRVIVRRRK